MNNVMQNKKLWIITVIGYVLLITFFDSNNLLNRREIKLRISELEQQRNYYQERITEDSATIENLNDDSYLECYAREHYLMKRADEQLYVISH